MKTDNSETVGVEPDNSRVVSNAMGNVYDVITPENIDRESYYNAVQLCKLLSYANAPAAIKALNLRIGVKRDKNGNIASIHSVDAATQIYQKGG